MARIWRICHRRRRFRLFSRTVLVSASLAVMIVSAAPIAAAQTITSPTSAKTIVPWDDYATQILRDGWDMKERTDVGWFTWGLDQPASNISSKRMAVDGFGSTIFTGLPNTSDPSIFLLDSYSPGAARRGRLGINFPIETSRFTRLLIRMRVANEIKPPAFANIGTVPVMQVYWSRDSIYFDPNARPTGGTYTTVDGSGNQVGTPFSSLSSAPFGAMEGGHYVIFSIPVGSIAGLQALNPNIAKWKNVNANNAAVDVNWGSSNTLSADSLRFKPVNLSGNLSGTVDIDWMRLVAPGNDPAESVTWSGGGTYDIVISTATDCGAGNGDYAVLAYSKTSGYQFNPQTLPNGKYYVGLRDALTASGSDTPNSRQVRACSAAAGGSYTVLDYPALTFTSPSPTGSADDFATAFLGKPWDFTATSDVDFSRRVTSTWNATVPAERLDGSSLGNVPLFFGVNAPGDASTGGVGDPHLYLLWSTARGLNNRIDTRRYRLFTTDVGVDRERDLANGSTFRVVWHIAGETWFSNGATLDAENVTSDIPLRHMRKGNQSIDSQSANYVLDRVQLDLADRSAVPLETAVNGSPSRTGWFNDAVQCGGVGCSTFRVQPFDRVGLDSFRVDPHEFTAPTNFFMTSVTLAAHETTGTTFSVRWNSVMPAVPASGSVADPASWKVRLYAVRTRPESSQGAGDGSPSMPVTRSCTTNPGTDTFVLTSPNNEPTLASGQFDWQTGQNGLVSGALYFVCAGLIRPGQSSPSAFTFSQWPVIYTTSLNTTPPKLFLSDTALVMSAQHTGANSPPNLTSKTPPQTITVTQVGGQGAASWLVDVCANYDPSNPTPCTGALDFIQLSQTNGSGSGSFTVALKDSSSLPQSTGANPIGVVLRVREASAGAVGNSPQYAQISITIYGPQQSTSAPFGQVDVPSQNATAVRGAIGVSGWVLDDVGVSAVKIYRNCLSASEPSACQSGIVPGAPSTPVVYLGDALFITGARPDVQNAFPAYPQSDRAGWGFGILTNMLPRTTGPFAPYGGQGPITLYAVALDVDGHRTLLGRSWSTDHSPTQLTMDNDAIAKPFGVIDTPSQGGNASGMFANFGWVLTPDNGTGINIPNDGSTIWEFVDGRSIGRVTYNQCRGTVGNPPPPGVYCNDDVSQIFGNQTPQPPLGSRTSNPSRYRNLDAGRGPQGSFVLNTTGYSNGLHVIAWSVTDSAGRVEGIGERYFVVQNGSSGSVSSAGSAFVRPVGRDLGAVTGDLEALETPSLGIGVRTGWALDAPFARAAQTDGQVQVSTSQSERIELALPVTPSGSEWEGYLVSRDRLVPLPAGSHLDPNGQFTWQPGAGFLGEYDMVFVRANAGGLRELVRVRITVTAK